MDTQLTENPEEPLAETPEDVAILYSWANLHGAKYRDFSASRREYRAQVRHRAAEDLRLAELQAKQDAEQAAAEAERVAREAERTARSSDQFDNAAERERALGEAESAARRAAAERVEAARRAESAAIADAVARREEREIAEAHASAQRQAARWADSEIRRRTLAGPQPSRVKVPGLASDPYEYANAPAHEEALKMSQRTPNYAELNAYADRFARPSSASAEYRVARASGERQALSGERRAFRPELESRRRPQGYRPDDVSGMRPAYRPPVQPEPIRQRDELPRVTPAYDLPPQPRVDQRADLRRERPQEPFLSERPQQRVEPRQDMRRQPERPRAAPVRAEQYDIPRREEPKSEPDGPAWLYAREAQQPAASSVADTLQHSRERVASRWFALKGVFEPGQEPAQEAPQPRQKETRTPVLAVFSLAGGVGKTSLTATLGRTLSSLGEKVLLADTTSHGLLPYYFGATELRPGAVRTFSPPSGSTDAPIYLVSYDVDARAGDRGAQEAFDAELTQASSGTHRIVLDVNASAGWVVRRLAKMSPTVLVPVSPDMNSVISLQGVEKYFAGAVDQDGRPILPYYLLNQFDVALPLHLDVREVLREKLGERLLPFVIRRAPAVSEALAEGMTVVDYAPEAGIAEDYLNVANWVRTKAAPASQGFRNTRWSER